MDAGVMRWPYRSWQRTATVLLRRCGEDGNAGGGRAIGPKADAGLDPAKRVSLRPSGGIRGLRRAAATEHPEVGISVARPAVTSSRRQAGSAADSLPTGPAARVPPSGVPEGRLQGVGGAPKTCGRAHIQWQPADTWTVGEARPPGMSGVIRQDQPMHPGCSEKLQKVQLGDVYTAFRKRVL